MQAVAVSLGLLASLALVDSASGQCVDQSAPTNNTCMAGYGQTDLAQSFIPTANDMDGAGVFLSVAIGSPEPLWIQLWDALPNAGGQLLASGGGIGSPGTWFDVHWSCVSVTPGATYYLVFAGTASMCYAGDNRNGYPHGIAYANLGYRPFPNYDYTFRTYRCCGPSLTKSGTCPGNLQLSVAGCTPGGRVALLYGNPGSFVKGGNPCSGLQLGLASPTLASMLTANASGLAALNFTAPTAACGKTVQAVDVAACAVSNTAIL